jgi:cyanophycinase
MKRTLAAALALASVLTLPVSAAPKGYLFIIGGGDRSEAMMRQFVALAEKSGTGKIVVFPMAGAEAEQSGLEMADELRKLGAKSVVSFNLNREQAEKIENAAILDGAGGVYFTGGDQARVTKVLVGTPLQARLLEAYGKGVVVGGTSAGAAVMSRIMITGDERRTAEPGTEFSTLEAGMVITTEGLGFITSAIIDQHFATRKRHNRLISLVAENPSLLGIGIDEATAIVVNPDETFDVIGDKDVIVYDPAGAKVSRSPSGVLGIVGLTMHVLLPGAKFDLRTRKPIGS